MKNTVDIVHTQDSIADLHGNVLAESKCNHDVIGEVEVIYRSKVNGTSVFTRSIKRNELLVTGATFISEKINNVRSTFKTTPLDLELGVHTTEEITVDSTTVPQEKICGVMIGNGGCSDTYNTVQAVSRAARAVPGMIPFRVVETLNDISGDERKQYFLRVAKGDYAYYYGKKFNIDREINVQFEDGTTVPVNVDTIGTSKFIKTFTKYMVTLTAADVREYFKITQGSTLKSLVNSVGLLTGYPGTTTDNQEEFYNVRGMTTLNMENNELKDSESTITFIYRLYIQ